jgi:two-component system KDP operon response regulator KdpE
MTTRPRILLVDDEASIQRAVGPLLRPRGYEMDIAGTGAQALEMFGQRQPALIVLDLGLPDVEGTEVCRRIRLSSQVPIIVLSARGAETDKVNALDYDRRRVVREDVEIRLTPEEFDLLSLLPRNHDRVLTHPAILNDVWGPNAVEHPEHLWTLVAQLRKKIEPDPSPPKYLVSEPWVGYRFVTDET